LYPWIGKLFLAGVLPGILLTVMFVFTIAIVTWHNPALAPTVQERASFADRLKALREVWAVAALFTLVIGGMYGGVFTATEAAGIGAFGTLRLAFIRGRLTWGTLWRSLASTAETVAIISVILVGAVVLGYFLAVTQLPMKLSQTLADSGLSPTSIMLMIIVAYLIMGAFMDELAMILLTVPILFPVTQALGYDPVWFGVIIVVVCQAGMIAPPVGLNVFVISGMVKDVPMQDMTYTMIKVGEGTGGGLMKNPIPNAPSCWVAYVLVDDLKKAVEKAKVLGGTVMKDETQVKDKGSFVIIEDPIGAMLGLWESTK
jgi:tripartite ATP-independent transporter DctM subunit